jgi:mevalonate kinase
MKSAIEFHANGKLLIAGEYLVLAGAKALALPVRFGQRMIIQENDTGFIEWESTSPIGTWFATLLDPGTLQVISTDNQKTAADLQKILIAARHINPDFLAGSSGWNVCVTANYPLEWGLGSSSTLCSLIAGWAKVDAFELFRAISKGSGYDIACAGRPDLLYYQLHRGTREIIAAEAGRALRENTWFAYLGNKQDSATEVNTFLTGHRYSDRDVAEVSLLSQQICGAVSAGELIQLVNEHELILSALLKKEPVARRFSTFPGTVKSLGAWGGDFAMFVSGLEPGVVVDQLHGLGFLHVFSYDDLAIKS